MKYMLLLLVKSIPIIVFIILIPFMAKRFEIKIANKYRYIYGIIPLIILCIILYPFSFTKKFYFRYVYTDITRSIEEYSGYMDLYAYYGIYSGMYYQYLNSKIDYNAPTGYDKKRLEKIENVQNDIEPIGKPNIIVILSESFFDINKLESNITFNKNVVENYNRFSEEGDYINTITPAFGGQTANIVFELLTGGNISYFSEGYVPFQDLYRDGRERNSLVKVLNSNGYNTSLMVGADSYNSENTMQKIGFDSFSIIKKEEEYPSDDYLADLIITELQKNRTSNFIMVETMQNHMPYHKNKYEKYDIEIENTTLNKTDSEIIKAYAQGVYDADKMLKKVYDYINKMAEDTILLFFGDHLPPLKNLSLEDLYPKLDYFNTKDNLKNTYRKYNTGALILSNFEMNIDFPENLGYDLLLNYIVNHLDINVPAYYSWLYSTSRELPTYNRYVAITSNNDLVSTNNLKNKEKEILNLRSMMFYKNFIEK